MTDATTELGLLAIPKREAGRRLSIILSLVLVLAAAGASLFLVRSVDTQLSDIANTYEVRRQARELILALVDAETGQRGYLITQDAQYLKPTAFDDKAGALARAQAFADANKLSQVYVKGFVVAPEKV